MSLDMLLAMLGGYFHIIYLACFAITFMYRNYNFNMSLIRKIYHTDSRGTEKEPTFVNDIDLLKHRVKTKETFTISFWRFTASFFLLKFCCFCKACKKCACMKKRENELSYHDELTSRLTTEIDILEIIRNQR